MRTNVAELTRYWMKSGKNGLEPYGKIIVITDGPRTGTCIYKGNAVNFDVSPIEEQDVIDTTGAGDAFVGGFIAGLCIDKSLKDCAQIGCDAAYHIIKQRGCTLPNYDFAIYTS
ncbi:hypothetical protein NQ318_022754 [Aromia moschata]|uniref:Adenosine kinase n=1 Tax=Aromia moschata TaxID=1265417 RepID=A0AAV8YEF8_9CUCU|nr:hypothetical protein NQ318_022754 [Aromia moschata]